MLKILFFVDAQCDPSPKDKRFFFKLNLHISFAFCFISREKKWHWPVQALHSNKRTCGRGRPVGVGAICMVALGFQKEVSKFDVIFSLLLHFHENFLFVLILSWKCHKNYTRQIPPGFWGKKVNEFSYLLGANKTSSMLPLIAENVGRRLGATPTCVSVSQ